MCGTKQDYGGTEKKMKIKLVDYDSGKELGLVYFSPQTFLLRKNSRPQVGPISRIRFLMNVEGITITELAEVIGMTPNTIRTYLSPAKARVKVSKEFLNQITKCFPDWNSDWIRT